MARAESYLAGVRSGESIADIGLSAFDRERSYRDRLNERAAATKLEAQRHAEDVQMAKDKAAEGKRQFDVSEAETERHNKAMEALYPKAHPGRAGAAAQIPPEVKVAMANRDSVRKQISALAAGGVMEAPPELQFKLDAAEGALARVAQRNDFDLGDDAAATADYEKSLRAMRQKAQADRLAKEHPARTWLQSVTGHGGYPGATGTPSDKPLVADDDWRMFDK